MNGPSDRQDAPVIEFTGVSFAYNGAPIIDDAAFEIADGEFVSIIGPNGGGKTTILKLILGLLTPKSGEIRVFGHLPGHADNPIGYCPQHALYDPKFPVTVLDVVLMGRLERRWGGRYGRADKEAARVAMGEVGVADLAPRAFSELSGGQRQRVLIARALACDPALLLLDEPTANVDAVVGERLLEILQKLNQRMTILMVSHDLGLVSSMVRKVVCVNRRVRIHPTSEVTGSTLLDLYEEEIRMVRHTHDHSHGAHA